LLGCNNGIKEGCKERFHDGVLDGCIVGITVVGKDNGWFNGRDDDWRLGLSIGSNLGWLEGCRDGCSVGGPSWIDHKSHHPNRNIIFVKTFLVFLII
jgi:hypothetical protein